MGLFFHKRVLVAVDFPECSKVALDIWTSASRCMKTKTYIFHVVAMVPRGEVTLIFAGVGESLGVVSNTVFSALIIMVIVTTLITPPALKSALSGTYLKQEV